MAVSTIDPNGLNIGQIGGTRNLIINGAMQVAQRGTSSTSDGFSTVDRYKSDINNGTVTHSQEALSSGDPYNEGFRNFFRLTNTVASSSASDRRRFYQEVEAQNIAGSGWNYASTSSYITLSCWVRTSVAGSYYFAFRTFDGTAQGYVWQETLPANTWTKITKSVSGNANLTINNDNGQGFAVIFHQSNGTDFTGGSSLDQWSAYDNFQRTPDDTNGWGTTTGATYDVTGVQLEVGDTATPFEHRSYGQELALCQRYFQTAGYCAGRAYSTQNVEAYYSFPVQMRANPSVSMRGSGNAISMDTGRVHIAGVNNFDIASVGSSSPLLAGVTLVVATTTASMTAGTIAGLRGFPANLDAEL